MPMLRRGGGARRPGRAGVRLLPLAKAGGLGTLALAAAALLVLHFVVRLWRSPRLRYQSLGGPFPPRAQMQHADASTM